MKKTIKLLVTMTITFAMVGIMSIHYNSVFVFAKPKNTAYITSCVWDGYVGRNHLYDVYLKTPINNIGCYIYKYHKSKDYCEYVSNNYKKISG